MYVQRGYHASGACWHAISVCFANTHSEARARANQTARGLVAAFPRLTFSKQQSRLTWSRRAKARSHSLHNGRLSTRRTCGTTLLPTSSMVIRTLRFSIRILEVSNNKRLLRLVSRTRIVILRLGAVSRFMGSSTRVAMMDISRTCDSSSASWDSVADEVA